MARWSSLALLVLLASPASADWLERGVIAASVADLATTYAGLRAGGREVSPLIHGTGSALAVKAMTTGGVLLLDLHLRRRGKHGQAKALKIAAIVVWGSCAAWNVRQTRRLR